MTGFRRGLWVAAFALVLASAPASARTLAVGPDEALKLPSDAAAAARDGDTIEIAAGEYFDCAVWHASHLTIEGEGDGAVITDKPCEGKGLFVTAGDDITIRNLTFSRARVPEGNGAGIRAEGKDLTVDHSRFINNESGILAAANPASRISISDSTFIGNGSCLGACAHAIYVNPIALLDIERSTFLGTKSGHHICSEAARTELVGSTIRDGADGTASYLVDLPTGGALVMTDDILEKGQHTGNHRAFVMIASDRAVQPTTELVFTRNTVINDTGAATVFVMNWSGTAAWVEGNHIPADVTEVSSAGYWPHRLWSGLVAAKDDVWWMGGLAKRMVGKVLGR